MKNKNVDKIVKNPKPVLLDPKAVKAFVERFNEAVAPELERQRIERMRAIDGSLKD